MQEKQKTDNQQNVNQEEVRLIYIVPDTCFISNVAKADNPSCSEVIYRSDVQRLIEKVQAHNKTSNQLTATFMMPTPLMGEIFSNASTVYELIYFMNGMAYTPIAHKKQKDPIRLTGDENSPVFDVAIRTRKIHFLPSLMNKVKEALLSLDKGIERFRLLVKNIENDFLSQDLYTIELNEKNVFALEREKGGKKHHFIDYQALLCVQTIKDEHGEPIVLTDDK
ncbi:MAG: hypothetical protein IJD25_00505, partial [Alphaproteobacteria bacterium]|nr:hypothetical protein [Alphaproteobacteria bacterium]